MTHRVTYNCMKGNIVTLINWCNELNVLTGAVIFTGLITRNSGQDSGTLVHNYPCMIANVNQSLGIQWTMSLPNIG